MNRSGFAAWAGAVLVPACVFAALQFPPLTGRVVDEANLLSPSARAQLAQLSEQHERATSNQLVVVTVTSLQGYPIEDYGYQLGRHWGIGQKGTNNGVLLIVAPNEREVRIEVGYGLEGALTDALSSNIIQTIILPRFKRGDFEGGIVAGAQAIAAAVAGEYTPKSMSPDTSGDSGFPSPVILILGIIAGQILALFISRAFAGALVGTVAGVVMWLLTGVLATSLFAAAILFLFIAFAGRGGRGGHIGGMGRGGGFGGGGFGGGGGSFGGGGASGRW